MQSLEASAAGNTGECSPSVNDRPPPILVLPPPSQTIHPSPDLGMGPMPEVHNLYKLQRARASYNKVLHTLRDNIALIATLVATFTYVAGINPPGGVYQDGTLRGTAIAGKRTSFRVFLVFNNIALFTSLSVVLVLLSIDVVSYQRKNLCKLMIAAHAAIWVAILFAAAAYAAASVVVMGEIGWTTIFVICVCGVTLGSLFVGVGIALVQSRDKPFSSLPPRLDVNEQSLTELSHSLPPSLPVLNLSPSRLVRSLPPNRPEHSPPPSRPVRSLPPSLPEL